MPRRWAASTTCFTGLTVPRALETWVRATSLVCGVRRSSMRSSRNSPRSLTGMVRRRAPFARTRRLSLMVIGVSVRSGAFYLRCRDSMIPARVSSFQLYGFQDDGGLHVPDLPVESRCLCEAAVRVYVDRERIQIE